jgi:endonuclease/exonuclease/phosphatase family metal-dependent hydrolase
LAARKQARKKGGAKSAAKTVRDQASRAGDRASEATARARVYARDARDRSVARVRDLGSQARDSMATSRMPPLEPHLCFVLSPRRPIPPVIMSESVRVATYNVHRWQGTNGRTKPDVARAGYVISEMDADVVALQEVLRPFGENGVGNPEEDPLSMLCEELDLHLAFAVTRRHRRGQLGNAILSRFPITAISVLDISHSRIERRGALAAQVGHAGSGLGVVATHLSLVDRTRHRQIQSLMEHPALNAGPAILMGDMNAWRNCKGSKVLEEELGLHHNLDWPASFPAGRPMLSLDRIYTRSAAVVEIRQHDSPAARKASDHLPVVAEVEVKGG